MEMHFGCCWEGRDEAVWAFPLSPNGRMYGMSHVCAKSKTSRTGSQQHYIMLLCQVSAAQTFGNPIQVGVLLCETPLRRSEADLPLSSHYPIRGSVQESHLAKNPLSAL